VARVIEDPSLDLLNLYGLIPRVPILVMNVEHNRGDGVIKNSEQQGKGDERVWENILPDEIMKKMEDEGISKMEGYF
jgi:hypothetical protein